MAAKRRKRHKEKKEFECQAFSRSELASVKEKEERRDQMRKAGKQEWKLCDHAVNAMDTMRSRSFLLSCVPHLLPPVSFAGKKGGGLSSFFSVDKLLR
jgi:hypothetical protein